MFQTIPTEEKKLLFENTVQETVIITDTWECCCGAIAKQQLQTEDVVVTSAFIL